MLVVGLMSAACGASERVTTPLQMRIEGPSGRLFIDDGGNGQQPPVLFIHSLAGTSKQWTPQLRHVRRTRRAVALDLRGHGRSEPPRDGELGPDAYAADVRQTLDTLGIQRVVLVGHSLGGGVAAAFAGLWPERAAGLLFVDPIDDPSKRPADAGAEAFLTRLEGPDYDATITAYWTEILQSANDLVREQVLADLSATSQKTVVGSMRAMTGFNAEAALARYRGPMLTITTPLNEFPSSLHNVVDRIRQEKTTGVSHWLHLDRPDEFNAALDRFLALVRH